MKHLRGKFGGFRISGDGGMDWLTCGFSGILRILFFTGLCVALAASCKHNKGNEKDSFQGTKAGIDSVAEKPDKEPDSVKVREISADEAQELLYNPEVLVLDVRSPSEYSRGHIKNARLVPLRQLKDSLEAIGR